MPRVTNVVLTIQRRATRDPNSGRDVSIRYTPVFTEREIDAGVYYTTTAVIRSVDASASTETEFQIERRRVIKARSGSLPELFESTITNRDLDEDFSLVANINQVDEWEAVVTMTPFVFENAVGNSPVVTGSWGAVGVD